MSRRPRSGRVKGRFSKNGQGKKDFLPENRREELTACTTMSSPLSGTGVTEDAVNLSPSCLSFSGLPFPQVSVFLPAVFPLRSFSRTALIFSFVIFPGRLLPEPSRSCCSPAVAVVFSCFMLRLRYLRRFPLRYRRFRRFRRLPRTPELPRVRPPVLRSLRFRRLPGLR